MSDKFLYTLARPLLFSLEPETAHHLVLPALRCAARYSLTDFVTKKPAADPRTVMGITFPNPVGMAAGLDKDGAYIDGLASLGFGSIEIGTVTPRAQPGNPKPRMFRLPQAGALINRLGFNNDGLEAFVANVRRSSFRGKSRILGLNIGKNATTPIERAADDYLACLEGVYPHADYVTVNISSPNTSNLRSLQSDQALDDLLGTLNAKRKQLADQHGRRVPVFVKIAPDLEQGQIETIAAALTRHHMDGVVATNTTISREAVKGLRHSEEAGGLSGAPVLQASNRVIRQLRAALGKDFPIVGVGGIMSAQDAVSKIEAGADVVQIYTGLIYRGPDLVSEAAAAIKALRAASATQKA